MRISARIFTIGHSNHKLSEFIEILKSYKLKLVVDVRTIPRSRQNPQFNSERFKRALKQHGVEYIHMSGLGGLRHAHADSINKGWRNASFRGYADYMQTEEFAKNLQRLISRSNRKRLVLMCAEAVPWRCHRALISDALKLRGIVTEDIFTKTTHRPHRMTPFAKVRGKKISYPAETARLINATTIQNNDLSQ